MELRRSAYYESLVAQRRSKRCWRAMATAPSFPPSSDERAERELGVASYESTETPEPSQTRDGDRGCKQEWDWDSVGGFSRVPMQRQCVSDVLLLQWEANHQD